MDDEPEALLRRLTGIRVLAGQHRIALSPDGSHVAYAVRPTHGEPEAKEGFYPTGATGMARGCALQVTGLRNGESAVPLSADRGRSWRPSWSPDSECLAFYADAGGAVHLHVWEQGTRASRPYPSAVVRCRGYAGDRPRWSPDGRRIYLPVCPEGLGRAFVGEEPAAGSEPVMLYSGNTAPPGTPTPDPRALWGADVGCIDLADGRLRRLTVGLPVAEPHPSPDGRWIAFYTLSQPGGRGEAEECPLYLLPTDGGDPLPVAVGLPGSSQRRHRPAWHPQSGSLAFIRDGRPFVQNIRGGAATPFGEPREGIDDRYLAWSPEGEGLLVRGRSGALWVMRPGGCSPTRLHIPEGYRISRPLQPEASDTAAGHRGLLVAAADPTGHQMRMLRLPLDGSTAEVLWEDEAALEAQSFSNTWHWFGDVTSDGGALVYARETTTSPADLWCRIAAEDTPHRLTDLNPDLHTAVRAEVVAFGLPGGREAKGLLWLPPQGVPPFPTVTVLGPDLGKSVV